MRELLSNPAKFADWFNMKYPDVYRPITTEDIKDMTMCGLIKRYGFFIRDDLKIVEGILKYELKRAERSTQEPTNKGKSPKCRRCGP